VSRSQNTPVLWSAERECACDPAATDRPPQPATVSHELRWPRKSLQATIADVLGSRQLLLVLDDCDHLIQACADLAGALLRDCPEVRILATSREPLGIVGEQVWLVAQLAAGEAVQLFFDRALTALPSLKHSEATVDVSEICTRLDGMPLAIELAAARVRTLTPAQIAARMGDRFRLLVGSRSTHPRHQTLEAAVHQLLHDQAFRAEHGTHQHVDSTWCRPTS
jgi:predicted ATPase